MVLIFFVFGAASGISQSARPSVVLENRTVLVGVSRPKVDIYAGIRFGLAAKRFARAEMYDYGEGEYDASSFGEMCPQLNYSGSVVGSEDCLTLNVVVPHKSEAVKSPVLAWIHGGGLTKGTASRYDLSEICSRGGMIGVSLQYRLNALGFLYKNVGLYDQVLALEWVRRHVSAFGGDPERVTIFGQSAGASSVLWLAAYHSSLFRAAIAESPWFQGKVLGGVDEGEAGRLVWRDCYCKVVECSSERNVTLALETVDVDKLVTACGSLVAVVRQEESTKTLNERLCSPEDNPFSPSLALLVGSNVDESRLWFFAEEHRSRAQAYRALRDMALDQLYQYFRVDLGFRGDWWTERCAKEAADWILNEKVRPAYENGRDANVEFMTDFLFSAGTQLAAASGIRYLFEQPILAEDTIVPVGTCHCAEMPYTLGFDGFDWNPDTADDVSIQKYYDHPTPLMEAVHETMSNLWISFAAGNNSVLREDVTNYMANGTISHSLGKNVSVNGDRGRELAMRFFCDSERIRSEIMNMSSCFT